MGKSTKDLQHVKLTVEEIRKDVQGGREEYVLSSPYDLQVSYPILSTDGKTSAGIFSISQAMGNGGKCFYRVVFHDSGIHLAPGDTVYRIPDEWFVEVPDCNPVEIEYISGFGDFHPNEDGSINIIDARKFIINRSGTMTCTAPESGKNTKEKLLAKIEIGKEKAESILSRLLRSVSENDCIMEDCIDDIGREVTFRFEDGTEIEYPGTAECEDEKMREIMYEVEVIFEKTADVDPYIYL